MSEEPVASGESSGASESPSQGTSTGKASYQVSAGDLAELGIDMGATEDDSGSDGEGVEYGKFSAEPQPVKEARLAKAKVKGQPKAPVEEEVVEASDADTIDEWLRDEPEEPTDETQELATEEDEPEVELVRYGKTHKMKLSEAKNYAQKGFDYESKIREFKGEREAFDHERSSIMEHVEALKKEYDTVKKDKEQIDALIEFIRDTDQEAYARVEQLASQFKRNYHNPFMERIVHDLKNELKQEFGAMKKQTQEVESKELRNEFYTQLAELKAVHNSKFSKYGIKMDEDAIQKEWIESGKPLKKIYGELYGDKLVSVADSKRNLLIKQKASRSAPTMGRFKTASKPAPDLNKALKKMSYSQIANKVVRGELR